MKLHPVADDPLAVAAADSSCRLCGAGLRHRFVDLGMSPPCENFRRAEQLSTMEPYFPLQAYVCGECFLVQLKDYVSPSEIFGEYAYFSSYSTSWVAHAKAYCEAITRRLRLGPESLVVEVASNDGYLLQHFLSLGIPVLGIDPAANVVQVAIERGIPTEVAFFGLGLAQRLASEGRRADLIIGNNVLAQVPDLNDFVAGMRELLAPWGVISLEFPHLERLMAGSQFDTIYHEHFSYFSLTAVHRVAARHGLELIDVEELPTHGGSLRVYLARRGAHPVGAAVPAMLLREARGGVGDPATYAQFDEQVKHVKRRLLSLLIGIKEAGGRICGYGAPGKGNTLLNYCGIGTDFLDFTVDRNPYKHGLFTPGMHVPIRPVEAIDAARPDYLLILPWNLRDEITRQMRHIADWGGRFIIPIPEPVLIDAREIRT